MNRVKKKITSRAEKKQTLTPSPTGKSTASFSASKVDLTVRPNELLHNPYFFACVRVLAESIAGTPLEIYDLDTRAKARDFYLYDIIKHRPNEYLTPFEVWQWLMIDCLRYGRGIAFAPRDKENKIVGIYPVPGDRVSVKETENHNLVYCYNGFEFPYDWTLRISDILCDNILGNSILHYQNDTLGISKVTEEFAGNSFSKGVFPSGFIKTPDDIGQEDLTALKEKIRQEFSGSANAGSIIVSSAIEEFKPFQISNQASQMLESRKFDRSVICGFMRVPAHLINDLEHATFSNVEHLDIAFVKHTLRPLARKIEQRALLSLLTAEERAKYFFEFNFNDLLRGDLASRIEALSKGINNAIYTSNEARKFENLPPLDGGDTLMVNSSLKPFNAVVKGVVNKVKKILKG